MSQEISFGRIKGALIFCYNLAFLMIGINVSTASL